MPPTRSLPEELGTLTSITHLDLCSNALPSLFSSLTNLQQLKLLNCDSNRLQALPETVPLLRSLVVLSVSGNGLRYLPDQLGYRQPMLASINCSGNAIEALPPGARRLGGGTFRVLKWWRDARLWDTAECLVLLSACKGV